jgi:tight adherence protein B
MELSVVVFAAVTLTLLSGYYLVTGLFARDATVVRRRIDSEFGRAPGDDPGAAQLFKKLDLERAAAPAEEPGRPAAVAPPAPTLHQRLEVLLEQSALKLTVRQLLTITAAFALSLGFAGALFRGLPLGLAGALVGAALPLWYVSQRRNARRDRLLAQLPGAFDLMARVIRAGSSVPQALLAVTEALEDPAAGEFALCQKQQNLGLRAEIAFQQLAQRTGILEMRIFVMAMLIQRQSGGNLSEVLERLARMIRDRQRLRNQVRTLTAEGRLQGLTLMVLPVLLFFVMLFINRQYAEVLLEHKKLLYLTGASMAAGALWIRKIVNYDI